MDGSLIDDLSNERPNSGEQKSRGTFRLPLLGWKVTLAAQSPDRSPAAAAVGAFFMSVTGLAIPLICGLVGTLGHLTPWTVPAAACAFAFTMAAQTRLTLWFQYGRRPVIPIDLTEREGDPTDRADLLIDEQEPAAEQHQHHELEITMGKGEPLMTGELVSSPWSVPGIAAALLILGLAALAPAATLLWLATVVRAPATATVISALFASLACAASGITMMIRIEQIKRGTAPPRRTLRHPRRSRS